MPSPAQRYVNGMHDKFKQMATWPPNAPLRLGDVGVLEGRFFKALTSLAHLNIPFRARPSGPAAEWKHSSGSGVRVHIGSSADAPGAAGKAVVDLEGEGAFVFQAKDCRLHVMEDLITVGKAVLAKHESKEWELDWVFVDTLVTTSSATAIISASSNASVVLDAKGAALSGAVPLAAGLEVASYSGDVLSIVAAQSMTPLFCVSGLTKRWFGQAQFKTGFRDGTVSSVLARVPFESLPDDRSPQFPTR